MLHAECERYVDAERHWLTAIEHARRAGDRQVEADALVGRGRVYLRLCDYPAARRALTAALNVYESIDDRGTSAEVAELLSSVPV